MASSTIRIRGLKETAAAFRRLDKGLIKELQGGFKDAAEPVASSARGKISRYQGASVGTIKPKARQLNVRVEQGARKVTGKRGDFGSLQQRKLIEALDENQSEVYGKIERVLDRFVGDF